MPRYQHTKKSFPIGMNDNADPALAAEARCQVMLGVCPVAPGEGAEIFRKKRVQLNASFNPSGTIEGVFQYTGTSAANDLIMEVKNGILHHCTISANAPQPVTDSLNFTSTQLVAVPNYSGVTFTGGARVRAVQHKTEMFFVQEGGLQPVRFNGTALYLAGIAQPAAPTDGGNVTGPLVPDATYQYAIVFADELGRLSSPSTYLAVFMGAGGGRIINWTAPTDQQVQRVYLVRSNAGGTILYNVLETGFGIGVTTYTDNAVDDDVIVFNTGAPMVGQNDQPLAASMVSIYKQRLVLNATSDDRLLQVSNLDAPTQFSVIGPLFSDAGQLLNATDGITFRVINEFGDEITGLGHLGSVLGVWNRRTTGVLAGNDPSTFQYQIIHRVGCIATDSIMECGNQTVFMSEDGLYALSYETGFTIRKISEDLDNMFRSAAVMFDPPGTWPPTTSYSRQTRASAAVATFLQNRYVLASPPYSAIYDFDTGGMYLDYMTGMPYGDGSLSRGYLSLSRIHADRQYEVALYSPGIGGGSAIGDLYVMSFYPLTQSLLGTPEPFSFVYMTRAADGAGVPRERLKTIKRVEVFGTIVGTEQSDGTPISNPLWNGTISLIVDGTIVESYPFDNLTQVSTNYAGANFAADQLQGILMAQEWQDCTGFIVQVLIQGSANGRLTISDVKVLYDVLDGPG